MIDIRAMWRGASRTKKWSIGIGLVLIIGALNAGDRNRGTVPNRGGGYEPGYGGEPAGPAPMAYSGAQGALGPQAYAMPSPGTVAFPSGGGAGSADSGAPQPDIMGDWEARERVNEAAARGADQVIREQTDIRDSRTNEITTDVPNDIANPAIDSGTYSAVPAAEVVSGSSDEPQ